MGDSKPGSDVELVRNVLAGDRQAAEALAERCRGLVIGLGLGRFALDRDAAEELLQQTIERLWERDYRALRNWRGEGKITTYVTVIATRFWLRSRTHDPSASTMGVDLDEAVIPEAARPAPQFELVAAKERREAVVRSLDRLSTRDRLLLQLRFADEEPPARIAPLFGLSAGAARKAVHDALVRLRRELSSEAQGRS